MHPAPGCFGSLLAYAPSTAACQRCKAHVECGTRVGEVRPLTIKLLDRFTDANGRAMSWRWLTKGERAERKRSELAEDQIAVGLATSIDQRAGPIARRAAKRQINLTSASFPHLASLSPSLAALLERLQTAPATTDECAVFVAERMGVARATATRDAKALVSFLVSHGRAQQTDNLVELL